MERIVLKHLSGSKANQVEEFPLSSFKELTIGRDPASLVKYDPDRDDLVGRHHAKLAPDAGDPTQFSLTDLNSRNGTYINKQRITGTARLMPGDVVQFGPGGPEFQFDLDPRPETAVRPTRVATAANAATIPPTRTVDVDAGAPAAESAEAARVPVGRATVERMIDKNTHEARKYLAYTVALVVLAVGFFFYYQKRNARMAPADIAKAYTNSVVYVEVGWKLIYTPTGGQLYHLYIPNRYKDQDGSEKPIVPDGRPAVAAYVWLSNDKIEPWLTDDSSKGIPIGGEHTGSGFTVTGDGFIMTNRHVAAAWRTVYQFRGQAVPGVLFSGGKMVFRNGRPMLLTQPPDNWVPSETKQAGQRLQGGYEGRNDYLNVTFAKQQLRIPAKLARVSDRHDVALIKIDAPEAVSRLELNDNYDSIRTGDDAIVMGYPGVSPDTAVVVKSQDVFNRDAQIKIVPDPTVSPGTIGRILRGQESSGDNKDSVVSLFGDAYQLTINSTGGGNSGGPVFDSGGRVIGIFFAGRRTDVQISFAVPIRFGKELLSVQGK